MVIVGDKYPEAIEHCNRVARAKAECEAAKAKIELVLQSVSENWQGQSGTAYYNALSEFANSLRSTISRLGALENQMRDEASALLVRPEPSIGNIGSIFKEPVHTGNNHPAPGSNLGDLTKVLEDLTR